MARAMGLNAVTTSVFWNVHEPNPGAYDFSGEKDLAAFIRTAKSEGLYVILKIGPYVGDDWTFGGLPAWLLSNPDLRIRSSDPTYLAAVDRWFKRLGEELGPLQIGMGGPILLVQLEDEYGETSVDPAYLPHLRKLVVDAGFTRSQLFTGDAFGKASLGSLPDLPLGLKVNGEVEDTAKLAFQAMAKVRPSDPAFASSLSVSWEGVWGAPRLHPNTEREVSNLKWILDHGLSVSLHVFHGGTNFGWTSGAYTTATSEEYAPYLTSRDAEAPLDEQGRPTPKYYAFRDVISKETGVQPPAVPVSAGTIAISKFGFQESVPLWSTLPKPVESSTPATMEALGQSDGYVLYRTRYTLQEDKEWNAGSATIHDFAVLYINGIPNGMPRPSYLPVGSIADAGYDRRVGKDVVQMKGVGVPVHRRLDGSNLDQNQSGADVAIDVLVENSGRLSATSKMRDDRKGIVAYQSPPSDLRWFMYSLPMSNPSMLHYAKTFCTGPCFYRERIDVPDPGDTFLDMSEFDKGQVWINGHALGRYWKKGPQRTLFVPGVWLHPGKNEVIVFDLYGNPFAKIEAIKAPKFDN
jgi:beta-galactosidase